MNILWKYLIESGLSLCLFYSLYWVFLRKDTFFARNRFYLALTIVLSMIVPLISVSIRQPAPIYTIEVMLDEAVITPAISYSNHSGFSLASMFIWFYWTGVGFFLSKFLFHTGQICWLIRKYGITVENGTRIVYIDRDISPFSFYNIIFLNNSITESEFREKILAHEKNHIRNRHTLDLVIFEILTIIQWFNPIAWLYKWSLKEVHEFQADDAVIREGYDSLNYQELIISQVFGNQFFRIAHNLNKSLLKKRIIMMTKFKSSKISRYKIFLAIPVALLIISLFSFSGNQLNLQNSFDSSFSPEIFSSEQDTAVYFKVDTMPKFQGGDALKFRKYLAKNLIYPKEAREKEISGRVFVQFVVTQMGKVEKIAVVRGVHPLLDKEAVRVISGSPDWEPGMKDGKNVNVAFTFPVSFVLEEKKTPQEPEIPTVDPNNPDVYFLVEEMPLFQGGDAGDFRNYIARNLKYPKEALQKGISGKVFVQFWVDGKGKIENVKVVRGVDPLLDHEAVRVVSESPLWKPGKQDGKTVKVAYTFPIVFALKEDKEKSPEVEGEVFFVVEQMPKFQGSDDFTLFKKYISENLIYPEESLNEGISGRIFISFVVDKEGNVRDVKMEKGIAEFEKEGIRVVQSSPKWEPGVQRGHKVAVGFTMPIVFLLPADHEKQPLPANNITSDKPVFFVVEQMPKFQGSDDFTKFRNYVATHLTYPEEAVKEGKEGKVFVQFVVDTDGEVKDAKVIRSADPILDKEALRTVSSSPTWEPGTQRGVKVPVQFTMPVVFKLSEASVNNVQDETVVVGYKSKISDEALFLIDGKIVTHEIFASLNPDHIESVDVFKGEKAINLYGKKAENGVVSVKMKSGDDKPEGLSFRVSGLQPDKDILYLIDGDVATLEEVRLLNTEEIEKIEVVKGEKAITEFGVKGSNGVIKITMK